MENMTNVEVQIVRMVESSGNQQFFVRARRLDNKDKSIFNLNNLLEYNCFQTNYNGKEIPLDECIEHAMFSSSYLLKFFGKTVDDLKLINFEKNHIEILKNSIYYDFGKRKLK